MKQKHLLIHISKETYKKLIAVKGERTWREMLEIAARELERNESRVS